MDQEYNYKQFVSTFNKFMLDLDRYCSSNGTINFLKLSDKLNMNKIMLRYYGMTSDIIEKIKNKDESIFDNDLVIFPDVNLKLIWRTLKDGQRKKLWVYLNMLYVMCDAYLNIKNQNILKINNDKNINQNNIDETTNDIVCTQQLGFNPYAGVGGNPEEYGIEEMFSGSINITDNTQSSSGLSPNLTTIASMMGLDKMINTNDIKEKLKNMTKEDINNATDDIRKLLGDDMDDKTMSSIKNVLESMSSEFNTSNYNIDSVNDFTKLAEIISKKVTPEIENGNIDIQNLMKCAQNVTSKFAGNTPLGGMLSKLFPFQQNNQTDGAINEDEYIENYKRICENFGITGIDWNNIDKNSLSNIMNQMNPNFKK